jgi:hypothetical protein
VLWRESAQIDSDLDNEAISSADEQQILVKEILEWSPYLQIPHRQQV